MKYAHIKKQLEELFLYSGEVSRIGPSRKWVVPQKWDNPMDEVSYWCATDGHIAAMIPVGMIGEPETAELDYGGVLSGLAELHNPLLFTLDELGRALAKCKSVPGYRVNYETCMACGGEGAIDDDTECETCDGEGEVEVSRTLTGGRVIYESKPDENHQRLQIGEGIFNPDMVSKIVLAIELMGLVEAIIQVTHNSQMHGSLLRVGEVMFLLMPVRVDIPSMVDIIPV
jgi:hypothetical protein